MGHEVTHLATRRLQDMAQVFLSDTQQWLDEFSPGWQSLAPDTVLTSALQALFLAEHARTERGAVIAQVMAHQVALLICQAPEGRGRRVERLNAFDRMLDRAIQDIVNTRTKDQG